jgi:peptidoglycan/LPS O-acetylase OafA/YrhL
MSEIKIELPGRTTGHLPVLDELKGFAIVLVILYHAGGVLVWQNFLHGDLGVDIFIILSGIGLALSSRTESTATFMRRRLVRILPAYWIVLTAYWICNTHYLQHHYTPANLALHYLGVHGWFGDGFAMSINDSFWFVTLIITLYLLFCAVRSLATDIGRILFVGAAFSCVFACVLFATNQSGSFGHLGLRVPGFFAGLIIGQILREGRIRLSLDWPLFCAALLFAYVPYVPGIIFFTPFAALALMGAYTFLWKRFAPPRAQSGVTRVLTFLGNHSLEIFLIHQPLIRDYNYYLHGRWFNIPVPSPTGLVVGIVAGLAVTLIVSVELRSLLAKFLSRPKSPA